MDCAWPTPAVFAVANGHHTQPTCSLSQTPSIHRTVHRDFRVRTPSELRLRPGALWGILTLRTFGLGRIPTQRHTASCQTNRDWLRGGSAVRCSRGSVSSAVSCSSPPASGSSSPVRCFTAMARHHWSRSARPGWIPLSHRHQRPTSQRSLTAVGHTHPAANGNSPHGSRRLAPSDTCRGLNPDTLVSRDVGA